MDEMLKRINKYKMNLELSLDEAMELRELLEKRKIKDGIPTDDGNKCPNCHNVFTKGVHFCPICGQRVFYIELDYVPL